MTAGGVQVIKVGGAQIDREGTLDTLCERARTAPLVIVHGGGPQLDDAIARRGLKTVRVAGRRVTSREVLALAVDVWTRLGDGLVGALESRGIAADRLVPVRAVRRPANPVDYGEVGDIVGVDERALGTVLGRGEVAVVGPLAAGPSGFLNVNADTVAAEVAVALGAERLVVLTSAPGLLADPDDPRSVLPEVDLRTVEALVRAGVIRDGMRPKLDAARRALERGVAVVQVTDGRGKGTLVRGQAAAGVAG